jgi:hypothetical protein
MKTIFGLCAAVLVIGGFLFYRSTRLPDKYGIFTNAPKAAVSDLIQRPKDFTRKTVSVEGIVRDQCTAMGCYFFFQEGSKTLRIDLQDIAMNAPRHKNGHPVIVEGQMVKYGDGYQLWASAVEFK